MRRLCRNSAVTLRNDLSKKSADCRGEIKRNLASVSDADVTAVLGAHPELGADTTVLPVVKLLVSVLAAGTERGQGALGAAGRSVLATTRASQGNEALRMAAPAPALRLAAGILWALTKLAAEPSAPAQGAAAPQARPARVGSTDGANVPGQPGDPVHSVVRDALLVVAASSIAGAAIMAAIDEHDQLTLGQVGVGVLKASTAIALCRIVSSRAACLCWSRAARRAPSSQQRLALLLSAHTLQIAEQSTLLPGKPSAETPTAPPRAPAARSGGAAARAPARAAITPADRSAPDPAECSVESRLQWASKWIAAELVSGMMSDANFAAVTIAINDVTYRSLKQRQAAGGRGGVASSGGGSGSVRALSSRANSAAGSVLDVVHDSDAVGDGDDSESIE